MGKYLSPTLQQAEEAVIKCAVIFYPSDDGAFFLNAVRGALADLRFQRNWEGDSELTSVISQRFIETDLMTDETFFVKDCDILTEALENGEMAINVNVNTDCGCGCGGSGGGTVIIPNFPNPTDIPINPPPSNFPTDDGVTIPDGFSTYEEYQTYKCGVATKMVDDFTETIGNLQTLGGLLAVGSGYALTAAASAATYEAIVVGLAAAGLSVTGGMIIFSAAMIALLIAGASIFAHFDTIFDELTANRTQFICDVYLSSNETEVKQVFYDTAGTAVTNLAVSDGIRDQLQNAVVKIIDALVPSEIIVALFQLVQQISYEEFDCSTCTPSADGSHLYTFDADGEGWGFSSRTSWNATEQALSMHPKAGNSPDPTNISLQRTELNVDCGLGSTDATKLASFEWTLTQDPLNPGFDRARYVYLFIEFEDGTNYSTPNRTADGTYVETGWPDKELKSTAGGGTCLWIKAHSGGNSSNGIIWADNINVSINNV